MPSAMLLCLVCLVLGVCLALLLFPAPCLGLLDPAPTIPKASTGGEEEEERPNALDAAEALAQLMPSEGLYPQPRGGPGATNLRSTIAHLEQSSTLQRKAG